jgi:hypothetical protein
MNLFNLFRKKARQVAADRQRNAARTLAEDDARFHQLTPRATAELLRGLDDQATGYKSAIGEDWPDDL